MRTLVKGTTVAVELDLTDSTGAPFDPLTLPSLAVLRQDGTSPTGSPFTMQWQGASTGAFLYEYDTSNESVGPLTLSASVTMPDGSVVKRSLNVEVVLSEAI